MSRLPKVLELAAHSTPARLHRSPGAFETSALDPAPGGPASPEGISAPALTGLSKERVARATSAELTLSGW
jgi:hypothetical protein